jgi:hypothetical protein
MMVSARDAFIMRFGGYMNGVMQAGTRASELVADATKRNAALGEKSLFVDKYFWMSEGHGGEGMPP